MCRKAHCCLTDVCWLSGGFPKILQDLKPLFVHLDVQKVSINANGIDRKFEAYK